MPYTEQKQRNPIDAALVDLLKLFDLYQLGSGDLNYIISKLILKYFLTQPRYQTICNIDGVLSNASREFYARVARPYEDSKIRENGDLPEFTQISQWIEERRKQNANNKSTKRKTTNKTKRKS